jgi:hypothetical protein
MIAIAIFATASGTIGQVKPAVKKGAQSDDVEIRFAFSSITPDFDDSFAPIFMVIAKDGRAHALRYGLRYQTKNVAAYEGALPAPEVEKLFAAVRAAFHLPKHRGDYDRGLAYESDSFYLAVTSHNNKTKEMFGSLETRPEQVRALVGDITKLWRRLREVPPAYAYLMSRPIEKDRLKLLRTKYKVFPTPIESLPVQLQLLLIPVVTQPLYFHPLTETQYKEYQPFHRPFTYKGAGYEPMLTLSAKQAEPVPK